MFLSHRTALNCRFQKIKDDTCLPDFLQNSWGKTRYKETLIRQMVWGRGRVRCSVNGLYSGDIFRPVRDTVDWP